MKTFLLLAATVCVFAGIYCAHHSDYAQGAYYMAFGVWLRLPTL